MAKSLISLLDNDPSEDRSVFLNKCAEQNIEVFTLSRYSIENYYTIKALKKVFGSKVTVEDDHEIIHEIPLKKQNIGNLSLKRKDYPLKIAKAMNWEDIRNNDLGEFVLRVETIVNGS
ncbi:hypothetical protein [Phaeodactylibacter xiamenensis]|uniref:hypothetical protein n=1 Tax=Phaeodactylibacter xiamenensis TaxID=1524460 RepID=UPI003CCC07A9